MKITLHEDRCVMLRGKWWNKEFDKDPRREMELATMNTWISPTINIQKPLTVSGFCSFHGQMAYYHWPKDTTKEKAFFLFCYTIEFNQFILFINSVITRRIFLFFNYRIVCFVWAHHNSVAFPTVRSRSPEIIRFCQRIKIKETRNGVVCPFFSPYFSLSLKP